MDPWKDCRRIYDPHFMDRMQEKHLPRDQVNDALIDGIKIQERKGEYEVNWKKWTLKVSMGRCFLFLRTAIRN